MAQVVQPLFEPENFTDTARLIAAAPEMADALIGCCETCEHSVCGGCSIGRALHTAGIKLAEWHGLDID